MEKYENLEKYLKDNQYTWLVTGVAGFVGSNILESLLKLNQKVIGVDNFSTGYSRNIDEVLQSVSYEQRNNFSLNEGDVCSLPFCEKIMQGVHYVLHQSALSSVSLSIDTPLRAHEANVNGFINMLSAAKSNNVRRFVYASSSAVYGWAEKQPVSEKCCVNPLSPYAVTKCVNEQYADVFARCYGLESIGLRYFNVYGPRQDPNGDYAAVLPLWLTSMLNKSQIFINGDGHTTRDFCYIDDVVQANLLAATTNDGINSVYNIACGESITLNDLFRVMCDKLKMAKEYKPCYREFRFGDIKRSSADICKAKKMLNYKPRYDIVAGLEKTICWYINHLEKKCD